jgi:hypothetical protein
MRTYEQIAVGALTRALDFGGTVPSTRSLLYRRASVRQQELFSWVAEQNADYYGAEAIGVLDAGAIDFLLMVDEGVREAVSVGKVFVESMTAPVPPADYPYAVGDEITVIPDSDDPTAYIPPRATVRGHILRGIGSDLDEVEEIRVHYSYRPLPIAEAEDGTTEVEIEQPFDELLVVDLARSMARKMIDLDPARKIAIVETLTAEEASLLESLGAHVRQFTAGRTARHAQSQGRLRG